MTTESLGGVGGQPHGSRSSAAVAGRGAWGCEIAGCEVSDRAAAGQRATEGELVGELQIAAHR